MKYHVWCISVCTICFFILDNGGMLDEFQDELGHQELKTFRTKSHDSVAAVGEQANELRFDQELISLSGFQILDSGN